MAMNGNTLGDAIKAALVALDPPFKASIDDDFCRALGNAIVDHITSNAIVTTTSGAPDGEHTGGVS